MSNRGFLHPLAWLAWLSAVVVLASAARNPFYLGLALAWVLTCLLYTSDACRRAI